MTAFSWTSLVAVLGLMVGAATAQSADAIIQLD